MTGLVMHLSLNVGLCDYGPVFFLYELTSHQFAEPPTAYLHSLIFMQLCKAQDETSFQEYVGESERNVPGLSIRDTGDRKGGAILLFYGTAVLCIMNLYFLVWSRIDLVEKQ